MNIILAMIQGLILDLDYSTEQLERFACLAALYVNRDIKFTTTYTVDFINSTFSPDPTDNNYCLFIATYAVILIIQNELKAASNNSMKIVDGPSTIDLTGYYAGLAAYLKKLKDDYDKNKFDYNMNDVNTMGGYGVTTPTTNFGIFPKVFE